MRWVRFAAAGETANGIAEDDAVIAVEGGPFGNFVRTGKSLPLSQVRIEVPVVPPLADGDDVEVEITGIGILANRFVRAKGSLA
jgi:2-keto-4-pentenoate hydratase/2-oxohepta-3-ene-1,7-dioic acid hydratase in catechol pathway